MLAEKPPPSAWRPGISAALLAAGIAALAGFAVVYVTLGRPDNAVQSAVPAPAPAPPGAGVNPLSRGHMAAFIFRKSPEELPEVKFLDAEGKERTLAHWRGKVVLLNLWATWCLPCRKEMPALDRLQAEMGSDKFQVVAVSVDRTGLAGARKFLDETKPDLVVWQVGTNDALRHVSLDKFKTCLSTTLAWLAEHKIDVVLIDPQYGAVLTKDEHYERVVAAVAEVAREARVLLVDRFEAMKELQRERGDTFYLTGDNLHLNDRGHRCMAEQLTRAIVAGLLQADSEQPTSVFYP